MLRCFEVGYCVLVEVVVVGFDCQVVGGELDVVEGGIGFWWVIYGDGVQYEWVFECKDDVICCFGIDYLFVVVWVDEFCGIGDWQCVGELWCVCGVCVFLFGWMMIGDDVEVVVIVVQVWWLWECFVIMFVVIDLLFGLGQVLY